MAKSRKNIVVIGGGTGTSVVLEGLKRYPVNLSAIITTADDGSSSGVLRAKYGMIPPGDARQCLVALASGNFGYLNDRFQAGFLRGHTLGNILLALFYEKKGDFQQAVDELLQITGGQGSLLPMTLRPVTLVAKLKDGKTIRGEKNITPCLEISAKLDRLVLSPKSVSANPRAVASITNADLVVVGPGNLFSSIIPNFLVPEIREAFQKSKTRKLYVANLCTQPGHTDGFGISDFVKVLAQYIGEDVFTHVLYNNRVVPEEIFKRNRNAVVGAPLNVVSSEKKDKRFIGRSIASITPRKISSSDPIAKIRNPFLHDPHKLARAIMGLM